MSSITPIWGLQFHPEVEHTEHGREILKAFFTQVAKIKMDWGDSQMMDEAIGVINKENDAKILCAFSGGVDSLVAASLCEKSTLVIFIAFLLITVYYPQDIHINLLKETNLVPNN